MSRLAHITPSSGLAGKNT